MKYFQLIMCFLFLPLMVNGKANVDSIRLSIKYMEDGLRTKEVIVAQKSFAPDFSINIYSLPFASGLLQQIMEGITFQAIRPDWQGMKTEGSVTSLEVRFALADGKEEKSMVAFNESGKILFVDYFDRLFGDSRYRKSSLVAVLPFQVEGGSIILSARLNDSPRVMSFLLDTGADGMAIRRSLADSIGLKVSRSQETSVVGGRKTVQISSDNTLRLSDSLSLKRQNIAIFENVRNGTDGIIGLNLIRKYITEVDFDTQTISLYTYGEYSFRRKGRTIPLRAPSLIMLPSKLNLTGHKDISGNFIMDTGANYYLIAFSQFVRENRLLLSGFKPEGSGATVSLGHSTPVYYGRARSLKVGSLTRKNIPVTLQASTSGDTSDHTDVDGSIGIQFFSNFNFTIDLLRKVIHLSPRKKLK
ncbi:hypothetical protein F070042J6_46730 [Bacteroides sp. f07]|uniref:aspartyl protease family protein n=1 Tax=Bacteroides sp. f07 TaxID=3132704 RepID=UPI0034AA1EA3